jgi:hypothetical protein
VPGTAGPWWYGARMSMLDAPLQPGMFPTSAPSYENGQKRRPTSEEIRGVLMAESEYEKFSLEHQRKVQTVRQLFYRARDARRNIITQWRKNYKVLNNKTWTTRAEAWMPTPEVSNIWPLLSSMVAWMTDQRPSFETTPALVPFSRHWQNADKIAEHMNACLASTFTVNNLDAEIEKVLWDVGTYGIGYTKTVWEPWLADGLGDSAFRRVDPFTIYPDPYARSMETMNCIQEAKIMTCEDVDRAWPGAMKLINNRMYEDVDSAPHKASDVVSPMQPRTRLAPLAGDSEYGSAFGSSTYTRSNRDTEALYTEDPVVLVIETWIRTHAVDTEGMEDGTARVTDRWKCIVTCGDVCLMEKFADEIFGFNTHPYDKMNLFDTGEWYGPSLVEFLTSPQESINRLLQQVEHNIMLIGNPILLQTARAGVRQTTITNRPGTRLDGSPQNTGWMAPPQLHPDTFRLIEYLESKMESIAGLYAIMRGAMPQGRNATDTINTVQDAAFVRVRATLRNLERMLRSVCQKMTANNAEFYTEPRIALTSGAGGDSTVVAIRSMEFYLDYKPGKEGRPVPLRFIIKADAGAERPTSRGARAAEADMLFAMQAIDEIEVLEAHAWPHAGEVAGRVMDVKAQNGTLGMPPSRRAASGRTQ